LSKRINKFVGLRLIVESQSHQGKIEIYMELMNTTVLLIIIANVVISYKGFKDRWFFEKYKFQIGPVVKGERIRLLSSGFLHVDQSHLFFNMLTLYFFADPVMRYIGTPRFLAIYFGSLLAGSLFGWFVWYQPCPG